MERKLVVPAKSPKPLTVKQTILEVLKLKEQGYKVMSCDNILDLRFDFLCWKAESHDHPTIVHYINYEDISAFLQKASPGLNKTYVGIMEQISELNCQRLAIFNQIRDFVEFPALVK